MNSPVSALSDQALRVELQQRGISVGPITGTTRRIYEKKLEQARSTNKSPAGSRSGSKSPSRQSSVGGKQVAGGSVGGGGGGSPIGRRSPSTGGRSPTKQADASVNSGGGGGVIKRTPTPPRSSSGKRGTPVSGWEGRGWFLEF